jgi:hypothetical protein
MARYTGSVEPSEFPPPSMWTPHEHPSDKADLKIILITEQTWLSRLKKAFRIAFGSQPDSRQQ